MDGNRNGTIAVSGHERTNEDGRSELCRLESGQTNGPDGLMESEAAECTVQSEGGSRNGA